MEGLPVAPRGQAAKPTHGEPTLLTSGKRKEAVSPARGGGREEMRPQTPGTTGMAGGGPLTAHAGTGPASHPPSPGARLGPREDTTGVTWRLKSLCSSPFLGGAGGWPFQSRSGGTEPSSPKTFSSWKHSVSTICHRTGSCENCPQGQLLEPPPPAPPAQLGRSHLILPGDRHAARSKLLVEVLVRGFQLHTLNRGELFDVQDILAINGLGLRGQRQWSDRSTTHAWVGSSALRTTPVLAWLCSLVWSQKPATHVLLKHGSPVPLSSVPLCKWDHSPSLTSCW